MRSSTLIPPSREPRKPRFDAVLAYIDAHLDDDLSVARLARVACASTFHFHHQFSDRFGLGVHRYVTLARLRRAAYQLAFRAELRVVDVAIASGYESPEAFARAFKKAVGQTPSAFRARPDWSRWNAMNHRVSALRARSGAELDAPVVTVERLPAIRVAALEIRGRPLRIGDALRSFIAWRKANRLSPARSATYNVFHASGEGRELDLCAAIGRSVPANALGIIEKWIPAGRWAVTRHVGTNDSLFDATRSLHEDWLPRSGERLGEGPMVVRRVSLFPEVAEHEAESEIFLPLQ